MENKTVSKIAKAQNVVINFLKESIDGEDIRVIKLEKEDMDWFAKAEAYMDDSFLKAMNMPPKKTRVYFSVKLDKDLEVVGYERMDSIDQ
ncbi:MAG: hypothetical protein ACEPOZ_19325 [Marinifilaceae bacterium]